MGIELRRKKIPLRDKKQRSKAKFLVEQAQRNYLSTPSPTNQRRLNEAMAEAKSKKVKIRPLYQIAREMKDTRDPQGTLLGRKAGYQEGVHTAEYGDSPAEEARERLEKAGVGEPIPAELGGVTDRIGNNPWEYFRPRIIDDEEATTLDKWITPTLIPYITTTFHERVFETPDRKGKREGQPSALDTDKLDIIDVITYSQLTKLGVDLTKEIVKNRKEIYQVLRDLPKNIRDKVMAAVRADITNLPTTTGENMSAKKVAKQIKKALTPKSGELNISTNEAFEKLDDETREIYEKWLNYTKKGERLSRARTAEQQKKKITELYLGMIKRQREYAWEKGWLPSPDPNVSTRGGKPWSDPNITMEEAIRRQGVLDTDEAMKRKSSEIEADAAVQAAKRVTSDGSPKATTLAPNKATTIGARGEMIGEPIPVPTRQRKPAERSFVAEPLVAQHRQRQQRAQELEDAAIGYSAPVPVAVRPSVTIDSQIAPSPKRATRQPTTPPASRLDPYDPPKRQDPDMEEIPQKEIPQKEMPQQAVPPTGDLNAKIELKPGANESKVAAEKAETQLTNILGSDRSWKDLSKQEKAILKRNGMNKKQYNAVVATRTKTTEKTKEQTKEQTKEKTSANDNVPAQTKEQDVLSQRVNKLENQLKQKHGLDKFDVAGYSTLAAAIAAIAANEETRKIVKGEVKLTQKQKDAAAKLETLIMDKVVNPAIEAGKPVNAIIEMISNINFEKKNGNVLITVPVVEGSLRPSSAKAQTNANAKSKADARVKTATEKRVNLGDTGYTLGDTGVTKDPEQTSSTAAAAPPKTKTASPKPVPKKPKTVSTRKYQPKEADLQISDYEDLPDQPESKRKPPEHVLTEANVNRKVEVEDINSPAKPKKKKRDWSQEAGRRKLRELSGDPDLLVEYPDMDIAGTEYDEVMWEREMEKMFDETKLSKGGTAKKRYGVFQGGFTKRPNLNNKVRKLGMKKGGFTNRGPLGA